jgi:hypothetical protein
VLLWIDRRFRIGHGRLFALYVAVYTFGRFWVELLRDDDATHIFGVRINSFTSTIVFVCAIAYFLLATKGREAAQALQPGGDRPWPWQLSALRTHGAKSAQGNAEEAGTDAGESEESEAVAEAEEPESADEEAGPGPESTPGQPESAPDAESATEETDATDHSVSPGKSSK